MEELKQAFYEVMCKYEKSFGETGVMANLNAWARNKASLLELLRRHPQWDEAAKAIVFTFDEGRGIEHDVVDEIAFTMEDLAAEQIKEEQQLEDFRISLRTAVSEYNSTLSEQALKVIRNRGGIKCSTGQKTSRIPYMRDKTVDERYFILTLFAVAFELAGTDYRQDEIVDVHLSIGLPPAHYGAQYERFENYFLNRDIIDFQLDGKPYSIYISKAICFPQAYAAIMPIYQRIRQYPKVAVLDIGGFTADYLLVKNGEADLSACDSLDNGVITLYNGIKSKVNADFDMLLDESDIDAILQDKETDYDDAILNIVKEQAQFFVDDLFGKLRERMIDLRSGKAVFVGGGSILLRKQIETSGKVGTPIFVDEISANTKGYELLFKASCMG